MSHAKRNNPGFQKRSLTSSNKEDMKKQLSYVNVEIDPNFIGEVGKTTGESEKCTFAEIWHHGQCFRPPGGRQDQSGLTLQFRFSFGSDTYCKPCIDLMHNESLRLGYAKHPSGRYFVYQIGRHKENDRAPLSTVYFTEEGIKHFVSTVKHFGIPISQISEDTLKAID